MMEIQQYIKVCQLRIASVLKKQLLHADCPAPLLNKAMAYAVLNGGKRLRPILAYASSEAIVGHYQHADIAACAIELVHSYSLVHDDLPAMDDDNLRRGLPTCHIAFNEAEAILAGDALQSLAFELLASSEQLSVGHAQRLKMIKIISKAIGWAGMVAGQSIDINASGSCMSESQLEQMHNLKTGALINASVQLGALSTGVATEEQLQSLDVYSNCIGLAFQIKDDILDVVGDTSTLGKQQGQDSLLDKPTYVSMIGLEAARNKAQSLCDEGIAALGIFGGRSEPLKAIARYIIQRSH